MNDIQSDDTLPREVTDSWAAPELPPEFGDRVAQTWMRERANRPLAPRSEARPPTRFRWLVAATALAAAVLLAIGLSTRSPGASVHAFERDATVELGPRARAHGDRGAALAWTREPAPRYRVQQREGRVRYEVQPGTDFAVRTVPATIRVTGTVFEVSLLASDIPMIEARKIVPTGAAVLVTVLAGSVVLENARGSVRLEAGESGVAYATQLPRRHLPRRQPSVDRASTPSETTAASKTPSETDRRRAAHRLRQALAHLPRPKPGVERALPSEDSGSTPVAWKSYDAPELTRSYIRDVVRDDLMPLVVECYGARLERDPAFSTELVLSFLVIGDESVGGIVDEVELNPERGVHLDPQAPGAAEFSECLRESMMSVVFRAPRGRGMLEVEYPIAFAPEGSDEPVPKGRARARVHEAIDPGTRE